VAAAEEGGEDELDPVALAVDDRLDVVEEPLRERDRIGERVVVCCSKRLGLHVLPFRIRVLRARHTVSGSKTADHEVLLRHEEGAEREGPVA
jgi:hypothetical protein